MTDQKKSIFVVIPAYNEQGRIEHVLRDVLRFVQNVIVVDDGSQDLSLATIQERFPEVTVIRHAINLGKGAAMKTGCEAALQRNAQAIIVMDGDGQHRPLDIPRFIEQLDQDSDIVFGARILGKDMPMIPFLGNKVLSVMINLLFHMTISDTQGGFRAFTADAYKKILWTAQDYAVETEMIVNAAKQKLRYTEVEIQTIYHDKYKGTTPLDGFKILFQMIKWKIL